MNQPDNRRPPHVPQIPPPAQYGTPQYGAPPPPNHAPPQYAQPVYDQYGQPIYPQQPYPQQPHYAPPQPPYAQPYGQPLPSQPAYGYPAAPQPTYDQYGRPIYPQQGYAQPEPQPIVVTNDTGWSGPAPLSQRTVEQRKRKKTYLEAQWILAVIGLIEIAVTGFTMMNLEADFDRVIEQQIVIEKKAAQQQGMFFVVDPVKLQEGKTEVLKLARIICAVIIAIGVLFLALALAVPSYPVGATAIGLVIYVGAIAAVGYLDPSTLQKGWILKTAFIAGLFRAIMAAHAFSKDSRQANFTAAR